jgi:hypothetical protein
VRRLSRSLAEGLQSENSGAIPEQRGREMGLKASFFANFPKTTDVPQMLGNKAKQTILEDGAPN